MTKTIRLSDLQLVLLSSAAARDNGSLIPLPENCTQDRASMGKAVSALLRRKLVDELSVTNRRLAWREQEPDMIGLFITAAGRAAIGAEPDDGALADSADADHGNDPKTHEMPRTAVLQVPVATRSGTARAAAPSKIRPDSKIGAVIALLERKQGATLDEIVEATGWLPHTTRAALTGLRKKGRSIAKTKRGDATCYRIEAEAAQ